MSIKSKFPSIKPSLLLDFANVKQLDPRVTFVRTTTATYYDGKTTAKAEQNLLLRSQDYSATWTVTNLTPVTGKTAPDTTSTATEFTAGAANAVLTQGYTAIAGSYTFSVWLRRVTGSGDIQIAADNGTWTTKTITGTWARYDVTQTVTAGSKTSGVRVVTSDDAIEVWGAQLEQRSAVTAYTPTTTQPITNYIPVLLTAPAGVARFDHNPVTGESLGLLIEGQRTNLLLQSEDIGTTWSASASSAVLNTAVAPNGTLTADKIVPDTTSAFHGYTQSVAVTASTTYTFTVYAKEDGYNFLRISFPTARFTSNTFAFFNLSTGTVATVGNDATLSASIQSVGNGWYRCRMTATCASTGTSSHSFLLVTEADNAGIFTGNGFSGVLVWGSQYEAGAFPTSYIPTVASSVTRNADAASMTGTNFSSWYRADEGTLYAEASTAPSGGTAVRRALVLDDGTSNNRMTFGFAAALNGRNFTSTVSNSLVVNIFTTAAVTAGVPYKLAGNYAVDNYAFAIDGAAIGTDTSGAVPVVNTARIGQGSAGEQLNGHIRKISFYPSRLSDAQLQALTTV
jgi:hypothetical protein